MSSCRPSARLVSPGSAIAPASLPRARQGPVESAAYEAGLRAGAEQALAGPADEMERSRRRLDLAAAALEAGVEGLRRARASALATEVADLAALAIDLVWAIAGHLPPGLSSDLVASALALVPGDERAELRVHPDDADTISDLPLDVKVVPDPGVERGGCVVEVGATRIDAQRSQAIERLRKVMEEA